MPSPSTRALIESRFVRLVLKDWADEKLKEADLIARMAGNP